MKGWVRFHRSILDHPLYRAEPFTKGQAWIDLFAIANHADSFFFVRGNRIDVKRGQLGMSQENLAERWKWSRGKVNRFLIELEKMNMIVQQKSRLTTLISITNYDTYQSGDATDDTTDSTTDGHQTIQQTDINNNDNNNNKNEKNNKKEDNKIKAESIERLYSLYPTKCPTRGATLKSASKDKKAIDKALKLHTEEQLTIMLTKYVEECTNTKIYMKAQATFYNNLPDVEQIVLPNDNDNQKEKGGKKWQ